MSARDFTLAVGERWYPRARRAVTEAGAAVEAWPVMRVVAALVAVQWLAVLATALTVRHKGWIYYQGGDQLWHYSLAWLIGHGQLTQTIVGYLWPFILAPIARVSGPNLVHAFPWIVLLDVLVLLPAAMCALYGIAARIGGRLFGYWTLVLWIAVPFIGIRMTNTGYHQRYTELTLPTSFGLTALSDFPTMIAALVSMYFVAKIVLDREPQLVDAAAGGVAAGAAIAVKPATTLFLLGPALALAARRRLAAASVFAAGLVPALVALAVWKERGLGNLPLLGSPGARQIAAGREALPPLAGIDFGQYLRGVSWAQFVKNLDGLREHFWSARLIEWLVIAGLIALGRRSRTALLLVGGSLGAFVVVKGGFAFANVEDASLFRLMMPAFPCFVLLLASLPLLLPHAPRALRPWAPGFESPPRRTRWALVAAAVVAFGVAPVATFAAAGRDGALHVATIGTTGMPVPANVDIGLTARSRGGRVDLAWRDDSAFGSPVFYRVWRSRSDDFNCPPVAGAAICRLSPPEVGVTHATRFTDRPGPGAWVYRVAVAANWLDDPQHGDPYVVSRPVAVTVR